MKSNRPILLVEDDQVDALTVKRAFREIGISNKLVHVSNGEEALSHLHEASHERPALILLDLNMPRMAGLEFLEIVKNDQVLKAIPIVVLTTSTENQDRQQSFQHSVAGFMIKPVDYIKFVDMMKSLSIYWSTSELP